MSPICRHYLVIALIIIWSLLRKSNVTFIYFHIEILSCLFSYGWISPMFSHYLAIALPLQCIALCVRQCNYKKPKVPKSKTLLRLFQMMQNFLNVYTNIYFFANTLDVCSFICNLLVRKTWNLVCEAIRSCFKKKLENYFFSGQPFLVQIFPKYFHSWD